MASKNKELEPLDEYYSPMRGVLHALPFAVLGWLVFILVCVGLSYAAYLWGR